MDYYRGRLRFGDDLTGIAQQEIGRILCGEDLLGEHKMRRERDEELCLKIVDALCPDLEQWELMRICNRVNRTGETHTRDIPAESVDAFDDMLSFDGLKKRRSRSFLFEKREQKDRRTGLMVRYAKELATGFIFPILDDEVRTSGRCIKIHKTTEKNTVAIVLEKSVGFTAPRGLNTRMNCMVEFDGAVLSDSIQKQRRKIELYRKISSLFGGLLQQYFNLNLCTEPEYEEDQSLMPEHTEQGFSTIDPETLTEVVTTTGSEQELMIEVSNMLLDLKALDEEAYTKYKKQYDDMCSDEPLKVGPSLSRSSLAFLQKSMEVELDRLYSDSRLMRGRLETMVRAFCDGSMQITMEQLSSLSKDCIRVSATYPAATQSMIRNLLSLCFVLKLNEHSDGRSAAVTTARDAIFKLLGPNVRYVFRGLTEKGVFTVTEMLNDEDREAKKLFDAIRHMSVDKEKLKSTDTDALFRA